MKATYAAILVFIFSTMQGFTMIEKWNITNQEWKERLTPEQYAILREGETEPSFTGSYYFLKENGIYLCGACELPVFSSNAKFDSGTGWPSFWQPISSENVYTKKDDKLFFSRLEVLCNRCNSHLGHVFDDGPPPTGKRYCINSLALKFVSPKP